MRLRMALLLAALATAPQTFAKQSSDGSDKLASVRVTGSARYHSDQIAAAIGLHAGQQVTRDDLQKAADALAQLGLFMDVQYRFASVTGGVTAEYQVKDAPTVAVLYDNFPWFTDAELTAAVQKSVPFFDGTAPEHGTMLDSIADALETLGVSGGLFAKVTHKLIRDTANDVNVQEFDVQDFPVTIAKLEFSDALAKSDHGVQGRAGDLVGKPYSRSAIQVFEFEQVRPIYLAKGHLHVHFAPPLAQLPKEAAKAAPTVNVVAPIDPGPVYAWNGVSWSGNAALADTDLAKLVSLRTGEPADGTKIEALWEAVRDEYGKHGYLDADVTPAPQFDDAAKRVAYRVTVSEGPQYRMGKLTLSGLSAEGERRIRQGWKIPEGALFDEKVYEQFLDTGAKEAFGDLPVHYEMIGRFLDKNPAGGTVDVLLDFQ